MPKKSKSTKSDLSLGKVPEPSRYESDEASYVRSEKKVQKKKKREGNEILDEITHKVRVDYGDGIERQKSDQQITDKKKINKTVLYNLLPILKVLKNRIERHAESENLLARYRNEQKTLKNYAPMMVCRGMIREHIKNDITEKDYSFTTTMPYINPALQLLKAWELVDTFREQPKQSTKIDLEVARETIQKFRKKSGLSPKEKLRLERAKILVNKKNEDTHPLYIFLTETGEKEIANFEKDARRTKSSILSLITQAINSSTPSIHDSVDNDMEDDSEE